ncbi:MAG: hypothetical protein ABIJ34_02520 [archaeon]
MIHIAYAVDLRGIPHPIFESLMEESGIVSNTVLLFLMDTEQRLQRIPLGEAAVYAGSHPMYGNIPLPAVLIREGGKYFIHHSISCLEYGIAAKLAKKAVEPIVFLDEEKNPPLLHLPALYAGKYVDLCTMIGNENAA